MNTNEAAKAMIDGEKFKLGGSLYAWDGNQFCYYSTLSGWTPVQLPDSEKWIRVPRKVRYLKPLHMVLNENPNYEIRDDGYIYFPHISSGINPEMLCYFGGPPSTPDWHWDKSWFEKEE